MNYTGITRYKEQRSNCYREANSNGSSSHKRLPKLRRFFCSTNRRIISTSPTSNNCSTQFASMRSKKGVTVVSVFHDVNLASLYCDRLLLMEKGEIAMIGDPQDVIRETTIRKRVQSTRQNTAPSGITEAANDASSLKQKRKVNRSSSKKRFHRLSGKRSLRVDQTVENSIVRRHECRNGLVSNIRQSPRRRRIIIAMMSKRKWPPISNNTVPAVRHRRHDDCRHDGACGNRRIQRRISARSVMVTAGVGNAVDVSQALRVKENIASVRSTHGSSSTANCPKKRSSKR